MTSLGWVRLRGGGGVFHTHTHGGVSFPVLSAPFAPRRPQNGSARPCAPTGAPPPRLPSGFTGRECGEGGHQGFGLHPLNPGQAGFNVGTLHRREVFAGAASSPSPAEFTQGGNPLYAGRVPRKRPVGAETGHRTLHKRPLLLLSGFHILAVFDLKQFL